MNIFTGSCSRPKFHAHAKTLPQGYELGMILSPLAWRTPHSLWAMDNDVFAHRSDPQWWKREGEARWLKALDRAAAAEIPPAFCVLPDVVGDWPQTVLRSWHYLDEVLDRGLTAAVALQDGPIEQVLIGASMIPADWWFVGGSKEWKWLHAERIVEVGHIHGVKVHIGRVCGIETIRGAIRAGADSCDGSQWLSFSKVMFPRLLTGLRPQFDQLPLQLWSMSVRRGHCATVTA